MRKIWRNSIALKQARIAIIAAVIVGFVFSIAQLTYDLIQEHQGTEKTVQNILNSMRDPATTAAYNLSSDLATKVLNGVFENPQINEGGLYAIFLAGENEILAHRTRPPADSELTWLSTLLFGKEHLHEIPLRSDENDLTIGMLQVRLDGTYLTQVFLDRAAIIFSAGLLRNLFLTLVLILAFYNTLTKPIADIARKLSFIDVDRPEKNLLPIPKAHEDDEIGTLVQGINKSLKLLGSNLEQQRKTEADKENDMRMFQSLAKTSSDIFWKTEKNLKLSLITSDHISEQLDQQYSLSGTPLFQIMEEKCKPDQLEQVKSLRQKPDHFRNIQLHFVYNNAPIVFAVSGRMQFDSAGLFTGYLGTVTNITTAYLQGLAISDAQEKLRQSQKMEAVGQLTGGIAHDFNNLLAIIIGNLELIEETLPKDSAVHKMLKTAIASSEKGAALTQQLLSFSRKQSLNPSAVDIKKTIENLTKLLRRTLGSEIEITTDLALDLNKAFIDPSQFENAIINLAINARDAMPTGGQLKIKAANYKLTESREGMAGVMQAGKYIQITVSDTGTGMSPDIVQKAMEPFFTTKEVGKGSGMGLAMVFGFIAQSNGNIYIESEVGRGTEITLFLKCAPDGLQTIKHDSDHDELLDTHKDLVP